MKKSVKNQTVNLLDLAKSINQEVSTKKRKSKISKMNVWMSEILFENPLTKDEFLNKVLEREVENISKDYDLSNPEDVEKLQETLTKLRTKTWANSFDQKVCNGIQSFNKTNKSGLKLIKSNGLYSVVKNED